MNKSWPKFQVIQQTKEVDLDAFLWDPPCNERSTIDSPGQGLSALGHGVLRLGTSHCSILRSQRLVSITCKLNWIGSRVAYSRCVIQDAEAVFDHLSEERALSSMNAAKTG